MRWTRCRQGLASSSAIGGAREGAEAVGLCGVEAIVKDVSSVFYILLLGMIAGSLLSISMDIHDLLEAVQALAK